MSSENFPKLPGDADGIFSPASTPRVQTRRASYRFWHLSGCTSQPDTDAPTTEDRDAVLPLNPITYPTEQILINVSEPKPEQLNIASIRSADTEPPHRDVLPTNSRDKTHVNGDEYTIEVTDSNSRILKLLDVDDGNLSDSSSQVHPGDEARLENDSKDDGLCKESSDEDCCRICHNNEQYSNELVSPCYCSGSLGKMHASCLNQWLQLSKRERCELCGYKYTFAKKKLKFIDFLRDPELKQSHRQLMWDLLSFFLITPISVVSIILILLAGQQLQWHLSWDVIGLVAVGFAQLVAYMVWFRISFQYHKRLWQSWKDTHQVMKLVLQKTRVPKRQATGGSIVKRKRRIWGRRRYNRSAENLHVLRFCKRYSLNRPHIRRVQ